MSGSGSGLEKFMDPDPIFSERFDPDPVCPERLDPDLPVCPERLDPDLVCPERLDPDQVNIRPDPQPCYSYMVVR